MFYVRILLSVDGFREVFTTMFRPAGYTTSQGFMGFLPDGNRMFFPTAGEYYEYIEELKEMPAPVPA